MTEVNHGSHPTAVTGEKASLVLLPKGTRDYLDARDRLAYTYITGIFPTHLQSLMQTLLVRLTSYQRTPAAIDGNGGSLKVGDETIDHYELKTHPMVLKVRECIAQGFRVHQNRDIKGKERKPFSKVFLSRATPAGVEKLTVNIDGYTKNSWS